MKPHNLQRPAEVGALASVFEKSVTKLKLNANKQYKKQHLTYEP